MSQESEDTVGAGDASVEIVYDDELPTNPSESFFPRIEEIFENPALQSGLASGAQAINQSIDSLMAAIFYSLLDNELRYDLTDNSWFSFQVQRDLFDTTAGNYVVVDRFALGPRYGRGIANIHEVPLSLGIDATTEILQIYLRSDAARVAELQELSWYRAWLNNWFGLLPLLSAILPPSFNPNEMYDPIRLAETAFVFPLDTDTFRKMPVGSIRSYTLGGGVSLGISFNELIDNQSQAIFEKLESISQNLPYRVFLTGKHRINVFRKDEDTAWVGLTNIRSFGHEIRASLGNTVNLFNGALAFDWENFNWVWSGVPVPLFPFDASFEQAITKQFDQLYIFDLKNPHAVEAYGAAVVGDFTSSKTKYLMQREQGIETGVQFQFTKDELRRGITTEVGPNVTAIRSKREHERSRSEVEIKDTDGRFYVLEARQNVEDDDWDVLVGGEEKHFQNTAELGVLKVVEQRKGRIEYRYEFEQDSPMNLTLSVRLNDRYLDSVEFANNMKLLRYFSGLDLDEVPVFPAKDTIREITRRRAAFLVSPEDEAVTLHTPPTHLGTFGARAAVSISHEQMRKILSYDDDTYWQTFAKVLNRDVDAWATEEVRQSFGNQFSFFLPFLSYPLRLLDFRSIWADGLKEADDWVKALAELKSAETPEDALLGFYSLFNTDYPEYLARALLALTDLSKVPRSVAFFTNAKGKLDPAVRRAYQTLNGKIFRSRAPFPTKSRYGRAQEKLAEFYMDRPRRQENQARIKFIRIHTEPKGAVSSPGSDGLLEDFSPEFLQPLVPKIPGATVKSQFPNELMVNLGVDGVGADTPLSVYVRVVQAGTIDIGRLELSEGVLKMLPVDAASPENLDTLLYRFSLTDGNSPLRNFIFDQALSIGSDIRLVLSVSVGGEVWSEQKTIEFRYDNGSLRPIEEEKN